MQGKLDKTYCSILSLNFFCHCFFSFLISSLVLSFLILSSFSSCLSCLQFLIYVIHIVWLSINLLKLIIFLKFYNLFFSFEFNLIFNNCNFLFRMLGSKYRRSSSRRTCRTGPRTPSRPAPTTASNSA